MTYGGLYTVGTATLDSGDATLVTIDGGLLLSNAMPEDSFEYAGRRVSIAEIIDNQKVRLAYEWPDSIFEDVDYAIRQESPLRNPPIALARNLRDQYERLRIFNHSKPIFGMVQFGVDTPPVDYSVDDMLVIGSSPTGVFAGRANAVARFTDENTWFIQTPEFGWHVISAADPKGANIVRSWDGSAWVVAAIAPFNVLGAYAGGTTYSRNDLVEDQNQSWVYINAAPGSGHAPPTMPTKVNAYWQWVTGKGDKGDTGSATSSADVAWTGDISPTSLSSDQDDYNPSGLSGAAVIRHASSAEVAIFGSAGGADGRLMIDANISAYAQRRRAERASSTAANRYAGPDIEIDPGAAALRIYDSTSQRWRPVAPRLNPLHLHAKPDPFPTVPHKPTVYADWSTMPWLDRYFTFTRASVGSYLDRKGILRYAPAGVPRFHTIYSDGQTGLLIEGTRTNLFLRSDELSATWNTSPSTSTMTANAGVAPDETTTADLIVEDTDASTTRSISQTVTIVADSIFTVSTFIKRGAGSRHLRISAASDAGANSCQQYFDLGTGALGVSNQTGTGTRLGATMEALPNGWFRVSVTGKVDPAATSVSVTMFFQTVATGTAVYTGDGVSGLYFWGMQFEVGGYLTSYIPTTSAAVTRAADACYRSNADAFINQTEGYIFAEGVALYDNSVSEFFALAGLSDGASSERVELSAWTVDNTGRLTVTDGGSNQCTISGGAITFGTRFKAAGRYAVNDFAISLNGAAVGTDTSGTLPTTDRLEIGRVTGSSSGAMLVQKVAVGVRAATNAQLQAMAA